MSSYENLFIKPEDLMKLSPQELMDPMAILGIGDG